MINYKSISSGSKGNCSLVFTDKVKLLIDVGVTYLYIKNELEDIDMSPTDIDFILVSHIHSDHVKGLKQFVNKTKKKVFVPRKMEREILTIIDREYVEFLDDVTVINDLKIELIYTSHDTECSVGYVFSNGDSSVVHITDTGYINRKYMKVLENKSMYFLESNHDEKMLMDGPYPYYLKQRVISDYGHLSNKATSKYLSTLVGDKTKFIVLAHISENNNTPDIAFSEVKNKMDKINYTGEILVAKQNESLEVIEV